MKMSEFNRKSRDCDGCIVALGNVLLDIIVPVSAQFLSKYDLEPDTATLATDKHLPMFEEIQKKRGVEVKYSPGGCAANTLRVAQWILRSPGASVFIGAVGDEKDEESVKLMELMTSNGILLKCQKVRNVKAGRCAVLTHGVNRTLVTQLGASVSFSFSEFMESCHDYVVHNAKGFFLRVCMQTVKKVLEIAVNKRIPIVLNLNAVWVVESFHKEITEIIPYIDFIIANKSEAIALSNTLCPNFKDVKQIAKCISLMPIKFQGCCRTVVITRGDASVIVAQGDSVFEFPTLSVPQENIVDTNGAGDAFAGGFLSSLWKNDELDECVKCGLWAAAEVIQQIGCNFPKDKEYSHTLPDN